LPECPSSTLVQIVALVDVFRILKDSELRIPKASGRLDRVVERNSFGPNPSPIAPQTISDIENFVVSR
jgi:hypothetical protein